MTVDNPTGAEVQPGSENPAAEQPKPGAPKPAAPAGEGDKKYSQADIDRMLGEERRKLREKESTIEGRLAAIEAREHDVLVESLAVGGVKKELLASTGLKGDALKTYAAELAAVLAEAKPADAAGNPAPVITLDAALGSIQPNGVTPGPGRIPANAKEALANLILTEVKE